MFLCDTGLLCHYLYSDNVVRILNNDINVNYGSIYENVVAQELKCHHYNLYYYNNKKNGEVDFIIENGTEIIPIEVKSGKDYKRHIALENLLNNSSYNINKAYTLCQGNIEYFNNRIYLPIYMIMFLNNKKEGNIIPGKEGLILPFDYFYLQKQLFLIIYEAHAHEEGRE